MERHLRMTDELCHTAAAAQLLKDKRSTLQSPVHGNDKLNTTQ